MTSGPDHDGPSRARDRGRLLVIDDRGLVEGAALRELEDSYDVLVCLASDEALAAMAMADDGFDAALAGFGGSDSEGLRFWARTEGDPIRERTGFFAQELSERVLDGMAADLRWRFVSASQPGALRGLADRLSGREPAAPLHQTMRRRIAPRREAGAGSAPSGAPTADGAAPPSSPPTPSGAPTPSSPAARSPRARTSRALVHALDAVATPVLLCSAGGRLLAGNRDALAALGLGDGAVPFDRAALEARLPDTLRGALVSVCRAASAAGEAKGDALWPEAGAPAGAAVQLTARGVGAGGREMIVTVTRAPGGAVDPRGDLEKYRDLFTQDRDALFLLDPESHVVLEANRAAVELTGRPDLVGLCSDELVAEEDRALWAMTVAGAASRAHIAPAVEMRIRHDDAGLVSVVARCDAVTLRTGRRVVANLRRVRLPAFAEHGARHPGPRPEGGRPLVVVADDDPRALRAATRLLERLGFEVLAADGGDAALALYRARRDEVALVVLDVEMPGTDGLSVWAWLKHEDPSLPILLCSGYDELDRLAGPAFDGRTGFLPKPFPFEALAERVKRLLDPGGGSEGPAGSGAG